MLLQDKDGKDRGEQWSRATGQRVDQRKVTNQVSALQEQKIYQFQQAADSYEDKRPEGKGGMGKQDEEENYRGKEGECERLVEPDKGCASSRSFGKQIPGGMKDCGNKDDSDSRCAHKTGSSQYIEAQKREKEA